MKNAMTDPDGSPYIHNAEQAEAHKLARVEGDGPVSNETARAYLKAYRSDAEAELKRYIDAVDSQPTRKQASK